MAKRRRESKAKGVLPRPDPRRGGKAEEGTAPVATEGGTRKMLVFSFSYV